MLPKGTILHGNLRVDGYLSSGGFGNTYVVTYIGFDKKRAVKEFFMKGVSERNMETGAVMVSNENKVAEFNGQLRKFKKEAQRIYNLNNEHIVKVYELFDENNTAYYVMDYIDGESLAERIERTRKPLTESQTMDVLTQVLDALREVHSKGIWHLDIKPANIMMDSQGVVKLIDFGASKQGDPELGGAARTSVIACTKGYAPIEQINESYNHIGPWTDFYALGATLYHLLTCKKPPQPSEILDDESAYKQHALPMPSSKKMRKLILWMMNPSCSKRPQSVNDILAFINPSKTEEIIPPAKPSKSKPQPASPKKTTLATDAKKSEEERPKPKLTFKEMLLKVFLAGKYLYIAGIIGILLFGGYTELQKRIKRSHALSELESNMVRVEGGTFTMGATSEQGDEAKEVEYPAHQVTLSGFYICKYEVTQELWQAVMGSNPSNFPGDLTRPIESVSWEDCQEFITKLNEMTGKHYRLPTEAEWEYAARGGNQSKGYKYSGSDSINDVAWYGGNSKYAYHHPVGQKAPNELGLYDMSGNVSEWCQDWYDEDYYSNSPSKDPTGTTGPTAGSTRVCRGGDWSDNGWGCRVSCRRHGKPSVLNDGLGLRLAL